MESSGEESEGEREKLRYAAVTALDLSSSSASAPSSKAALHNDQQAFLACRLERLLDSVYEFTSPSAASTVPSASPHEYSSGIRLISSSTHPVTSSPPHTVTLSSHPATSRHPNSSASTDSEGDDELEKQRLQEAVYDPALLLASQTICTDDSSEGRLQSSRPTHNHCL